MASATAGGAGAGVERMAAALTAERDSGGGAAAGCGTTAVTASVTIVAAVAGTVAAAVIMVVAGDSPTWKPPKWFVASFASWLNDRLAKRAPAGAWRMFHPVYPAVPSHDVEPESQAYCASPAALTAAHTAPEP